MKKDYSKPTMLVVELRHRCSILTNSKASVTAVKGNAFDIDEIKSDEGYSGEAY